MKTLISRATIIDKRHPENGKKRDILIDEGVIAKIGDLSPSEADEVIEGESLCVSIGWMDLRANYRDPGEEYKEGLSNGLKVAIKSGFTAVALSPDTTPPIDTKGAVEYLINRSRGTGVEVIPIGAASKGLKGESMSEMYDMYMAGARGFGDDKHTLSESGLLKRALLYTANFGAPVFHFPYDDKLIPNGQVNEGARSTAMGLKGIPAISEEMMVRRDLTLLEYAGGILHLGPLSSARSLDLVHVAKSEGLMATTEVSVANLTFDDAMIEDFDSNFKVMPPLRSSQNRENLVKAFKEGKIDVISSDHSPEDEENKKLEFDLANFGMATQEIFFPLVNTTLGKNVDLDKVIATFSIHPREILGVEVPEIKVGKMANLVVFDPLASFEADNFISKGFNIPANLGKLKGRVIRTFCKD